MATLIQKTILAGGETELPADNPSGRLDTAGEFSFVGALEVSNGMATYTGSAVAISPDWVLTAGHNADLNDDGLPDAGLVSSFHLPGYGSYAVGQSFVHPDFSGFANPSVHDDLALLRLDATLPAGLSYPDFGSFIGAGEEVFLVGFGRSGFGDYGYTTDSSLTDRRFGENVIDQLALDDEGSGAPEVFRYDFDSPDLTGQPNGSLGNARETIIAPGDSGGAALTWDGTGWDVVGINTFTEGFGGRFGDEGGGILVAPYVDWIEETTGIPEPSSAALVFGALVAWLSRRMRYRS